VTRRVVAVGLASVVGLFCLYWVRALWLPVFATWLDVGVVPPESDYALVLNGDESARPFAAASLIKLGLARKALVITSVPYPDQIDGIRPPTHEIIRRVLLKRGVPAKDIVILDRHVLTTFDEANAFADFLDSSPEVRVTVVTGDFHTRRARWVFRQVLGERAGRVFFVSAPSEDTLPDNWWRSETGVTIILGEYLRLGFYWWKYGTLRYWVLGICSLSVILPGYRWYRKSRPATEARQRTNSNRKPESFNDRTAESGSRAAETAAPVSQRN